MKDILQTKGTYTLTLQGQNGTQRVYKKNVVVSLGLEALAKLLVGKGDFTQPKITHFAVGTGNTGQQAGDTQLENEIGRKQVTQASVRGNMIHISTYFNKTEAIGTIGEVGLFFDGTSSVNSGILFSRIAGGSELPITKNDTETLTIDYQLTIQ